MLFGKQPCLSLFCFMFEPSHSRGEEGWGMVTLKSKKQVFHPFAESYRDFKGGYFRVAPVGPGPAWLFEPTTTGGSRPRFPLAWSEEHFKLSVSKYCTDDPGALSVEDRAFHSLLLGSTREYEHEGKVKVFKPLRPFDHCRFSVRKVSSDLHEFFLFVLFFV